MTDHPPKIPPPPAAPASPAAGAKGRSKEVRQAERQAEIVACQGEMNELLERYDATLGLELALSLGENGGLKGRWIVEVRPK